MKRSERTLELGSGYVLDFEDKTVSKGGRRVDLTPTEFLIMTCLGTQQPASVDVIAYVILAENARLNDIEPPSFTREDLDGMKGHIYTNISRINAKMKKIGGGIEPKRRVGYILR